MDENKAANLMIRKQAIAGRQVILYPGEDGFIVAECPSLPGCVSQGKTMEEAVENIRETIQFYVETLSEYNQSIPAENFQKWL